MSANIILQAKDLKKYYGKGETEVHALDGVNLEIEAGKFVAIIGTSGSGKSTLLNMLGGLDTPTSGTVTIGNTELSGLNEEQLTVFRRRRIGFIFQNYNLIPTLNVWENIVFPIAMDGQKPDKKFIHEVVQMLGLEQKSIVCPTTFPAVSSSVWPLPGPWLQNLISYLRMNLREIWIPRPATT